MRADINIFAVYLGLERDVFTGVTENMVDCGEGAALCWRCLHEVFAFVEVFVNELCVVSSDERDDLDGSAGLFGLDEFFG